MIALGTDPFGGRLGQGGVGLERFMKKFDFPSFLIDRLNGVSVQVEVAAGQIQHARTVVFVCKDLPLEQNRKVQSFDPGEYGPRA